MQRYLVIGLAKTGTTVVSQTVKAAIGAQKFGMEPKTIGLFENMAGTEENWVAKILYDHWEERPCLLNALIRDEPGVGFTANILITRDPRAELVSRILYLAYPYFMNKARDPADEVKWVDLFRRKEEDPSFSLVGVMEEMTRQFGIRIFDRVIRRSNCYASFVSEVPADRKTVLRYEDFVAGAVDDSPIAKVLRTKPRASDTLHRTRRTGGQDDWRSFMTRGDVDVFSHRLETAIDLLGYPKDVEPSGTIDPVNCSGYVARLIAEAKERRKVA